MATAAQQQAFVSTYGPYANQAADRLGMSGNGNIILAQWAQESGWGTSGRAASMGNMAGINYPGSTTGTNYQSYNTPQAFTDSYVTTMSNPRYASAISAGQQGDSSGFVSGLKQGGYFTGDQTVYTNNVNSNVGTINSIDPSMGGTAPNNGSGVGSQAGNTSNQGYGSNGTTSSGEITTDPTTGYTSIPGTNTGATPSSNTLISGAAATGYVPPASTGGPYTFGLASGVVSDINSWLSNTIMAPITGFFEGLIGTGANYALRGFVILIAVVILLVALWRIMDPSGEKTQALVKGAAAAA